MRKIATKFISFFLVLQNFENCDWFVFKQDNLDINQEIGNHSKLSKYVKFGIRRKMLYICITKRERPAKVALFVINS